MSHQRMRILVVDDELTARLLMRAALEKSGFEVCLAENGEDALCQIRTQSCDLVMLDVEMPGMNGLSGLRPVAPRGEQRAAHSHGNWHG